MTNSDDDTPDKSLQMRVVVNADGIERLVEAKWELSDVAEYLRRHLSPLEPQIDIRMVSPENDNECFGGEHTWERVAPKYSDKWTRECLACGKVDEVVVGD